MSLVYLYEPATNQSVKCFHPRLPSRMVATDYEVVYISLFFIIIRIIKSGLPEDSEYPFYRGPQGYSLYRILSIFYRLIKKVDVTYSIQWETLTNVYVYLICLTLSVRLMKVSFNLFNWYRCPLIDKPYQLLNITFVPQILYFLNC